MFEWRYSPIDSWKPFDAEDAPTCFCDVLEMLLKQKPGNVVEVRLAPLSDAVE